MTQIHRREIPAGQFPRALALALLVSTIAIGAQAGTTSISPVFEPTRHSDKGFGKGHHDPLRPGDPGEGLPAAPVPEPGTMALASMGLIALGAATRKFRGI